MSETIQAIKALHTSDRGHNPDCYCGVEAGAGARCRECRKPYPCPTIALTEKA